MPEMFDNKFKKLHDTLHKVSNQLKEISVVLAVVAEELHTIDSTQERLFE